jgi:hypothetical protein
VSVENGSTVRRYGSATVRKDGSRVRQYGGSAVQERYGKTAVRQYESKREYGGQYVKVGGDGDSPRADSTVRGGGWVKRS